MAPVKSFMGVFIKGKLGDPQKYFSTFLTVFKTTLKISLSYFDEKQAYKLYAHVRRQHNFARKFYTKPSTKPIQPKENENVFVEKWKEEISNAVAADLNHIDSSTVPNHLLTWKTPLAISELDMALSQFIFIWMYWCFPKLFGIKSRAEELKGVIHLLAINGKMAGIQDEYNICLNPDPELFDLLTKNFFVKGLKMMDETVVTVQSTMIDALWPRLPFMTYVYCCCILFFGSWKVVREKSYGKL
ncbi:unnamed protein product [Orchesella dallaii]|uniref:Uncharacterized protein n=1 Tax=Orchesella dallaii TaxID=48710 RepID=A0ABP1RM34_9HEXA